MIVGVEESKEEPCARTTPQEKAKKKTKHKGADLLAAAPPLALLVASSWSLS